MMVNRIVHVTTVHKRNDIRILVKECIALSDVGYEVHLVVGDGKGNELFETVHIHDIGACPSSRIRRMWQQPKKAFSLLKRLKPCVVHFHDPELLPLGLKLKNRNIRVIYDVHEDVPRQSLNKNYLPKVVRPFVARFFEFYENYVAKRLSGLVVATPHIQQRFLSQGIQAINVNNYPLMNELAPAAKKNKRIHQICYIGGISRMRGLLPVIQALTLVPDVRLVLCGEFNEERFKLELQNEPGWSQVDYIGQADRSVVRRVMGESSAGLVTFLAAPNHVNAQPNKLFEYMSAELPVIASNFPLWREIVEGSGCGVCVDPESPQAIAQAISMLLDSPLKVEQMGCAGRKAVLSHYNWPNESQKLVDFYESLI